jgi:hypothetical protein
MLDTKKVEPHVTISSSESQNLGSPSSGLNVEQSILHTMMVPNLKLNDGNMIPVLGLGKFSLRDCLIPIEAGVVQVLGSRGPRLKRSLLPLPTLSKMRDTDISTALGILICLLLLFTLSLRHSRFYQNEKIVGAGIHASGVPRSEIFVRDEYVLVMSFSKLNPPLLNMQISSKVWCTWLHRVEEALDQTLTNLGTNYLDC